MMMMMMTGIFTYGTNTYRYSFRRYFGCMPSWSSSWSSHDLHQYLHHLHLYQVATSTISTVTFCYAIQLPLAFGTDPVCVFLRSKLSWKTFCPSKGRSPEEKNAFFRALPAWVGKGGAPRGASLPIMGLLVHIAMRTSIILDFLCAWIRPCAQKICAWSQPCANEKWKTKRGLHKQNKRRPWWLWKSVENILKAPWQNSKNKWCNPSESSIYIYPVSPRTSLNSEKEKGFHHFSPGIPLQFS